MMHLRRHVSRSFAAMLAVLSWTSSSANAQAHFGQQRFKLTSPAAEPSEAFGRSVDISGEFAIVGAHGSDTAGPNAGAAYLVDLVDGRVLARILSPEPNTGVLFGRDVAIDGDLVVISSIGDDGDAQATAYVFDISDPTEPVLVSSLRPDDGTDNNAFARAVAISGELVIVGASQDDDMAVNAGAAYVFNAITGNQIVKLTAHDGDQLDNFGRAVDIEGEVAIVGCFGNDDFGTNSGAAYLFNVYSGVQTAKLLPDDGDAYNQFGWDVALSGRYAAISSPRQTPALIRPDAAYLFDIYSGAQVAKIQPNPAPATEEYGRSIDVYDTTVIVGARGGSVDVFDISDPKIPTNFLRVPGNGLSVDSTFGFSVAIRDRAFIVGAYSDNDGAADGGAIHLFGGERDPRHLGTLNAGMIELDESFGSSVALSDGYAVVGASHDNAFENDAGSVTLFDAHTFDAIGVLQASDPTPGALLGRSIDIDGSDIVAGAHLHDGNGAGSGKVYLFSPDSSVAIRTFTPDDIEVGDGFGFAVAISNGTILAGAYGDDTNGSASGTAYLFDARTGSQTRKLLPELGSPRDRFGYSVDIDGTTVIVGAPGQSTNGLFAGAAYLFDASTGSQIALLLSPDGARGDFFGHSVAVTEHYAIVGAPRHDSHFTEAGAAYVFNAHSGAFIGTLTAFDPKSYDNFGHDVAIFGSTALVGSPGRDFNGVNSGLAFLFSIPDMQQFGPLIPLLSGPEGKFGFAVALHEDRALCVDTGDHVDDDIPGTAFLFDASQPCPFDWNDDGFLNQADYIAYFEDFIAVGSGGSYRYADPDIAEPLGILGTNDMAAYVNGYAAGCN